MCKNRFGVVCVFGALLFLSTPASAQSVPNVDHWSPVVTSSSDVPWLSMVVAGNVADIVTTRMALSSGNAIEANPIMRGNTALLLKSAGTALEVLVIHQTWKAGRRKTAIMAAVGLTVANGFIAAHNFHVSRVQ
jgi:hypothetical protein